MNNQQFVKYTADRYGLEENTIETMVDIFAVALQEIIYTGQTVTIDEVGEFSPNPPYSSTLKANQTISFKPSQKLIIKTN